ncbi:hypothetical protein L3V86_09180 [Thiotrichales bacterium 19S11-10]|nr:hypothetical protein [Thiotrichales bacterium 19S11-10]
MNEKITGNWKIIEMSTWDQEFVDLVVPGYFKFNHDGNGSFQFGCVEGYINYEISDRFDFSWSGNDECDPASGRGWVKLKGDNEIYGKIYIHDADSSEFTAQRQ